MDKKFIKFNISEGIGSTFYIESKYFLGVFAENGEEYDELMDCLNGLDNGSYLIFDNKKDLLNTIFNQYEQILSGLVTTNMYDDLINDNINKNIFRTFYNDSNLKLRKEIFETNIKQCGNVFYLHFPKVLPTANNQLILYILEEYLEQNSEDVVNL